MDTAAETAPHLEAPESATRAVWILAWPAVALNSLQVLNNLLDRFFIGHLPQGALTAYSAAQSITFLMFSLTVALGTGATAIVARAFGGGQTAEYRRASRQAFRLAVILGVVTGAITFLSANTVAHVMLPHNETYAIHQMANFVRCFALGLPGIAVIQTLAGALRGIGDTKSPMVISGFQIFLHLTLNFILIKKIGLGVIGAGLALSTSSLVSGGIYSWYVSRTPLRRVLYFKVPSMEWTRRILRIAFPAAIMAVLRVASFALFTLVLALVPNATAAIAGMGVAVSIEAIMFMPSFGISMASGALVGQSLGAKDPDQAERVGWAATWSAALITIAFAGPIFIAAPAATGFMCNYDPGTTAAATSLLRWLCATEFLFAVAMVLQGSMQGAGDTIRPTWISLLSLWLLRVPLSYIFALKTGDKLIGAIGLPFGLGFGAVGAWAAMSGTQAIQGLLSVAAFRQGKWKEKKV